MTKAKESKHLCIFHKLVVWFSSSNNLIKKKHHVPAIKCRIGKIFMKAKIIDINAVLDQK